ncbi:MAG: PAS domain-containing protein [Chloroflexi bacterium]|nr:PAS domain-containing protein [Chloroflexota bacterium]
MASLNLGARKGVVINGPCGGAWNAIFDYSSDLVSLQSRDFKLIQVNKAYADALGVEPKKLIGKHCYEVIHGTKKPWPNCPHQQSLETEASVTVEFFEPRLGIYQEVSTLPIFDEKGTITGIIHIAKDVSERKLAEEKVAESEMYYQHTLDSLLEGCQIIGYDWRYLYVNDAVASHGRRVKEKLLGHTMMEMYPGIEDTEMFAIFRHCMEKRARQRMENEFVFPDGTRGWFELSIQPVPEGVLVLSIDVTDRKRAEEKLKKTLEYLQKTTDGVTRSMGMMVELKDPYTAGHQQRVTQLACAIAQEMGLLEEQIEGIRVAGILHDIGKMSVPAEILTRPGKLSADEFALIKAHPQHGYNVLKEIDFPWPVAQAVLQHHESLDRSGYPAGLFGGQIILEARILRVADVVEAMSSHRPYRPALGIDEALQEILRNRGTLYDPVVVDAVFKLLGEKRLAI